jgi:hypothetical protein
MAEALYQALTDQAYRIQCRAMAPAVSQQFSARVMAEKTIAVYEQSAALHAFQRRSQRMSFVR